MPVPTKLNLSNALKVLIRTKPLQKITVKDITDYCELNRMTFYYHFDDIYDLVKWTVGQLFSADFEKRAQTTDWEDLLLEILDKILIEKDFILKVFSCIGFHEYEVYIYKVSSVMIKKYINSQNMNIDLSEADKEYIYSIYRYILVGILTEWITSGMKEPPCNLVEKFSVAMKGTFKPMCDNFAKYRENKMYSGK